MIPYRWSIMHAPLPALLVFLALLAAGGTARCAPRSLSFLATGHEDSVREALTELSQRHPTLSRLIPIGRSHEGRPLLALALSRDLDGRAAHKPSVLLNGAHHGAEVMSVSFVLDAAETLLEGAETDAGISRLLDELVIWCVPLVNPDGLSALRRGLLRTGRKNGRDNDGNGRVDRGDGVDINRNYPFRWGVLGERGSRSSPGSYWYRGPFPGSEPEVVSMMRLAESEHFVASISFHTGTVALLAPYTIEGARSPEPNEAWMVAEEIAGRLPPHPQGAIMVRRNLYAVDGTDQDFLRHRHGTLALLLEGARRLPPGRAEQMAILEAVRPAWRLLFDRFLDGPSIEVRVRDAEGRAVEVPVSIAEVREQEGEIWTTRCRDGRHFRYLPGPGSYTLRIHADNVTVERPVLVTGRARLDIMLPADVKVRGTCPPLCAWPGAGS